MAINLGRIYAGDYGQDLISNFNSNAAALEGAVSDIDNSLASKVGSSNVVMIREYEGALQYSLDGTEWKSADLTAWGNITGLLNDQIDLRDALNAKAAKSTVDNQQTQINTINQDIGTLSGNITTLGNSVNTLTGRVDNFATQIADMVTSGNIAYIRYVTRSGIDYFQWSDDNINWHESVVGNSAVWGNITGLLSDQTDLQQSLNTLSTNIGTVDGRVDTTNGNVTALGNTVSLIDAQVTSNTSAIGTLQTDKASASTVNTHISNTSNPHSVTKAQLGLGNVDNTSDMNKPYSTPQRTAVESYINSLDLIQNLNNVESIWLGSEADYLADRDLNTATLYFVNDNIDFSLNYYEGYVETTPTLEDGITLSYSVVAGTTSGKSKLLITATKANTRNLEVTCSGVCTTNQSTYTLPETNMFVTAVSDTDLTINVDYDDLFNSTETVSSVFISLEWK